MAIFRHGRWKSTNFIARGILFFWNPEFFGIFLNCQWRYSSTRNGDISVRIFYRFVSFRNRIRRTIWRDIVRFLIYLRTVWSTTLGVTRRRTLRRDNVRESGINDRNGRLECPLFAVPIPPTTLSISSPSLNVSSLINPSAIPLGCSPPVLPRFPLSRPVFEMPPVRVEKKEKTNKDVECRTRIRSGSWL